MDGTAPEGGASHGTAEDAALEAQIGEWVAYMRRRRELSAADSDELEDHLRNSIDELTEAGLEPDEAFLIAVKRMGSLDEVSREFAREHSERLWKQLVLTGGGEPAKAGPVRKDLLIMIACAAVAAIGIKIPALFGLTFDNDLGFYGRNFSLFALVPLAAYFIWRNQVRPAMIGVIAALFALGVIGANVYPLDNDADTTILTAIHLPIALWLVVGIAYASGEWRSDRRRMDFIRFTGEVAIYYVLIALGGGVLTAFTVGVFRAIGIDAEILVSQWVLPCGALAAVVVAAWLVGWKQSVIENMAPVLTRVFTPLFVVALLAFVGAVIWTGNGIDIERDVLILFDLVLVAVLGLLLYGISAREPAAPRGWFDWLQFALVVSALVIDVLVLLAVNSRIAEFGFSANKTAALGENLILLANLAWSAWLLAAFLWRRAPFSRLERWQTGYLIVYAAWAWIVVLAFPPIFDFV
ncbi:MAG: hypothetical protein HOU81_08880 [Hamadaea sp.]|uniref:permease prefix domain 1-containing protein n=1 Tax=Hamadaea sp. TaxID=2024425 RepID=UPI0017B5AA39|nr:permease prefix domain 1-containing protein [Hamadaea sp.]NUR70922.1 hypothetical protein [Hamadaea sp.]NUT21709.1 hypothetical protein [Hamadaea sp.]